MVRSPSAWHPQALPLVWSRPAPRGVRRGRGWGLRTGAQTPPPAESEQAAPSGAERESHDRAAGALARDAGYLHLAGADAIDRAVHGSSPRGQPAAAERAHGPRLRLGVSGHLPALLLHSWVTTAEWAGTPSPHLAADANLLLLIGAWPDSGGHLQQPVRRDDADDAGGNVRWDGCD